jgi:hypothetical protein
MQGYAAIAAHLAAWTDTLEEFVGDLDRRGTRYLSFSKVRAVEFCPCQYSLRFVRHVSVQPEPTYLQKGRLFHAAMAHLYRARARGESLSVRALGAYAAECAPPDRQQVTNAVATAIRRLRPTWAIVGVEEPFVLDMGPALPPCIGVVDLILRRDTTYAVVDYKTGGQFHATDDLQIALYGEYVQRRYAATKCVGFVEEYRWVNELRRARSEVGRRREVQIIPTAWPTIVERLARSYRRMLRIETSGEAPAMGRRSACLYSRQCTRSC